MRESYLVFAEEWHKANNEGNMLLCVFRNKIIKLNDCFRLSTLAEIQVQSFPDVEKDSDGWFPLPNDIGDKLAELDKPLSIRCVHSLLRRLEAKNLIRYERRGKRPLPVVIYIWVNFDLITQYLNEDAKHLRFIRENWNWEENCLGLYNEDKGDKPRHQEGEEQ